nr:hypothetical protein GCM10017611_47120 [Rhodococcus wratislaviensis]
MSGTAHDDGGGADPVGPGADPGVSTDPGPVGTGTVEGDGGGVGTDPGSGYTYTPPCGASILRPTAVRFDTDMS